MSDDLKARQAVDQARTALRNGDRTSARLWAEKAAALAPQSEDPWLILAAVASPQASLEYIQKALAVNPESPRARKGMEWAMQRLQEIPAPAQAADGESPIDRLRTSTSRAPSQPTPQSKPAQPPHDEEAKKSPPKKRRFLPLLASLLVILLCLVVFAAGYSAVSNPALAQMISLGDAPQAAATPTSQAPSWAQMEIAKPSLTATLDLPALTLVPSLTPFPTDTPTPEPTLTPEATATPEASSTPEVTETPGLLYAVIVEDTPTSEYVPPAEPEIANDPGTSFGGRWIDVNLSQQRVYAYEGDTIVNSFLASTGTWQTPTVTGTFKIWIKLRSTTMSGPGYYLTNVPYTMYFHGGYGIHGTYWHNNFGTPMSHGCVNLRTSDAEWLFYWASEGTIVHVHY
ncbi:MAG: L,D-transpeptidase family protein [Chloroflexota bacterium]